MVSRHELKKKLQEVQKLNNSVPIRIGGTNINNNITESTTTTATEVNVPTITTKKIIKVQLNKMITEDGTTAELYNPLPGVFWKAVGTPDPNGTITLKNPITGLFITDKNNSYCIGVTGDTEEFELRCVLGKNEIRINNSFLNIATQSLVKNGVEEK